MQRYDEVFRDWFGGELPRRGGGPRRTAPVRTSVLPDDGPGGVSRADAQRETEIVRARASAADVLRHRDVAELTAAERALLAQMFATLRPVAPLRRALRREPWHSGEFDARRTLREELRRGGEPGRLAVPAAADPPASGRAARRRLGLDDPVRGRAAAPRARLGASAPRSTEVFTVGTRLTRVTGALRGRDTEAALREAGEQVPDWSGGTRLGEVLKAFLDRWGARGVARGAVVVVFSDGWERGTPGCSATRWPGCTGWRTGSSG